MATNLTIAFNTDTQDLDYGTSGVDWTDFSVGNDTLIFSAGSDVVADEEPIPGEAELNQAGIIIGQGVEVIVSKYLLADISASQLKEIHNMGNQNKRKVMAFIFDGATASEPVLEAWDDETLSTIAGAPLGAGSPVNSWIKGVVTNSSYPGTNWTGIAMAGSSDGHFLLLNDGNGALTGADTLYCNLKIVVPSDADTSGAFTPALVCKYTTN